MVVVAPSRTKPELWVGDAAGRRHRARTTWCGGGSARLTRDSSLAPPQETPIVEVTRAITKHNYLVMDLADLPRIVKRPSTLRGGCELLSCVRDSGSVFFKDLATGLFSKTWPFF